MGKTGGIPRLDQILHGSQHINMEHTIALPAPLQSNAIILWLIPSLDILLIKVGEERQVHILPNK